MNLKIHFLGAAGTVTGSKFLLETPHGNFMVDCGMFQGVKELRELNWEPFPFPANKIDAVLLTHGHMDHTGYLPKLVKEGFKGEIYATSPTLDIAKIILEDSAKIQEEDAKRANEEKFTRHSPALPLYNSEDVEKTLELFHPIADQTEIAFNENVKAIWRPNGHILGSCFVELYIADQKFVFSGDVGRWDDHLLDAPETPGYADYLFLESTYGDQLHKKGDVKSKLLDTIHRTYDKGGTLIIPGFAVERIQTLMHLLCELKEAGKLPSMKMYMDSPMASKVLTVFEKHYDWHTLSPSDIAQMKKNFIIIEKFADTWKTIDDPSPKIVIAGSGMVTGGRVLSYLKHYIDKDSTTVLLTGYQAEGTRGRSLLNGLKSLKFYGKYYEVKATIEDLEVLSAHADQNELLSWISKMQHQPKQTFLIHGEDDALSTLQQKIENQLNWNVYVPSLYEVVSIETN